MKSTILVLVCAATVAAQDDPKFVALAGEYIEKYLESFPEGATVLGDHRYDSRLQDRSQQALHRTVTMQKEYLRRLREIRPERLNTVNGIDWRILESGLESALWRATVLREHEWNPMGYNPGYAIYSLLERDFAPLPKRLQSERARLEAIPRMLEQAKGNLRDVSRIHTETAILQNKGTINLIRNVVSKYLESAPQLPTDLAPAQGKAIAALESWGTFLQ